MAMPRDPEPTNRLQLHSEPELRPEIRRAEGQRLDAARAEFRAEWQAKVDRTKYEAGQADRNATWCGEMGVKIVIGGPAFGAYFGALIGLLGGFAGASAGFVIGGILGFIAVLPPVLLCVGGRWFYRRRTERLEREIGEMEWG